MDMKAFDAQAALGNLVAGLATGRIRIVDLTQTLSPDFPQIALPPEMGQCWPFRIEEVSKYDERGPGWGLGSRSPHRAAGLVEGRRAARGGASGGDSRRAGAAGSARS